MENLHVNQNQSRLLIVNYGYNNNLGKADFKLKSDLILPIMSYFMHKMCLHNLIMLNQNLILYSRV